MTIKVTYNVTDVYVTQDVSPVYINVSYSGGGNGGAAVWGGITGTLSDQTDLQNALNAKFDDPTGDTTQYIAGDGSLATFPAIPSGTVTSVGLTMPSAFSVANSPVTSSGTLAVTGAGTAAQYIRGDGQLANFPSSGGGGSAYNYYLNGSVNQGTFGGDVYYEMSKTPVLGAGTNFTRTNGQGNGYIASFITDAGDPSLLNIPGGNWNLEFYFQSSSTGGSPQFYAELYKVSSSNVFTLVASGSTNPEGITNGTTVDQYFTSIPVPQTTLLVTDRLAVRIYVIPAGRTITLHTENSNLCEILTTFSTGLNALNGLTAQVQYFATGTSGTDFGISSATDTHTFNLPTASSINRGALSSADWSTFSGKVGGSGASGQVAYWTGTSAQAGSNNLFWDASTNRLGIGTTTPITTTHIVGRVSVGDSISTLNSGRAFNLCSTDAGIRILRVSADSLVAAPNFELIHRTTADGANTAAFDVYANSTGLTFRNRTSTDADVLKVTLSNNVILQNGGTFTDGGQRLQVQGTTLLNGNVTFSSATGMTWDATNSRLGIGTNAPQRPLHIYSNSGMWVQSPTGGNSVLVITPTGFDTLNQNFIDFSITANSRMRLFSTGNLSLGSTTDSGERLQVTGTMKVTGASSFGGNLVFSGTTSVGFANTSRAITFDDASNGITYQAFGGHRFNVFNGSVYQQILTITGNTTSPKIGINNTTPNASAILDISSTTLGFLPPRMTTTQKNAISSPAAGLVVYDTTLAKLCVYTTAWETITSI
jgi:hypothetical protein